MDLHYRRIMNTKCSQIIQKLLYINQIVIKNCRDLTNDLQSFLHKKFFLSSELQLLEKLLTWELFINPEVLEWLKIKSSEEQNKSLNLMNSLNIFKSLKIRKICSCHEKTIKSLSQLKNHSPCLIQSYYMFNQIQNLQFIEIVSQKLKLIQEIKNKIFENLRKVQNFGKSFKYFHVNLNEFTFMVNSEILYINQLKKLDNLYDLLHDELKTKAVLSNLNKKLRKLPKIEELFNRQIFELKEPENCLKFKILTHFVGKILCLCIDEIKKNIYLGSEDGMIRCMKLENFQQRYVLIGHSTSIIKMVLLKSSKRLISSDDFTVRTWDLKNKTSSVLRLDSDCEVEGMSISIDEQYLAVNGKDGEIIIYDLSKSKVYKKFRMSNSRSSIFLNNEKLLIQLPNSVSLYDIKNHSNKKVIQNVYKSIIAESSKFILLISKSDNKHCISKYIIDSGTIENIASINELINEACLINCSKHVVLIKENSMSLLDIKKRLINKVTFPDLHIPSLKLLCPKNNYNIIAIYKKSQILMLNLANPDLNPTILTKLNSLNPSKMKKLDNFIYSPSVDSIASLDLNTNLISSTKLPFKPAIFKFVSQANHLIITSKNKIYKVYLNPLKILFEYPLKDKFSSLAIKNSSNIIAAGYMDSHENISYVQVINFDGKFVKYIKTHIKEKIKFLEFMNSSDNFVTGSKKGKIIIWDFQLSSQKRVFKSMISDPAGLALSTNEKYIYIISSERELLQLNTKNLEESTLDFNDSKLQLKSDLSAESYESLILSFII